MKGRKSKGLKPQGFKPFRFMLSIYPALCEEGRSVPDKSYFTKSSTNRCRIAATSPRIAPPSAARIVAVRPVISPAALAQLMASWAQLLIFAASA